LPDREVAPKIFLLPQIESIRIGVGSVWETSWATLNDEARHCVDCLVSTQTRLKKKSDQFEQEHKGHHAYMRRATGPEKIYEAA